MPAVRTPYRTNRSRRAPNPKARRARTSQRVSKLASSRVNYDRQVVESPSVGLGQGARTRLRTFYHYNAVLSATGSASFYLKPGSCFDPCGDTANYQPNLYDTWKTVFGRYLVIGATVKVIAASAGAAVGSATSNPATICCYPSISATAKTTVQDAASQPYAKTIYFQAGSDRNVIYQKLDHKKVLGRASALDSSENGAIVTADPPTNEFMLLPFFVQSTYTAGTGPAITFQIEIVQDVWFDRRLNVDDVIA